MWSLVRLELPKGPRATRRRPGQRGDPDLSATATALGPGEAPQHHTAVIPLFRHFRISFPPESVYPIPVTMAFVAQGGGPSNSVSRDGSRTALVVQNAEQRDASAAASLPDLAVGLTPAGTLRLRGAPRNGPHVAWDEHVVDNEGLGRKKSKSTWNRSMGGRYM